MRDVLKSIVSELKSLQDGSLMVGDEISSLDSSKFNSISSSSGKVVYVDGGQAELAGGANFSLQFIRVAAIGYDKVRTQNKFEHYVLITVREIEGKMYYCSKVFGSSLCIPDIAFDDNSMRIGNRNVEIGSVALAVRKIIELEVMKNVASTLHPGDILVRDGDLEQQCSAENGWWEALHNSGVIIAGLCKTSQAVTTGGSSANSALLRNGPSGCWLYSHGRVSFVKLHSRSEYVFRLDCFGDANRVASVLCWNSTDPVFYGYPYGLVQADMFARVSNKEKEYLRTIFMHTAADLYPELVKDMRSMDAHSVLDSM
ncbi:MAG: hypothetical protein ACE5FT_06875 [Candidatus Nanoarchaeia archaeon]